MIPLLLATVAALASAADPCAPVPPPGEVDPGQATVYAEVGQSELRAGAEDTAVAAFREALRHDPANDVAHRALDDLCAGRQGEEAFATGMRRLEAKAYRAAAEAFTRAMRNRPTPETALLLAICHYELGEDAEARPLLQQARASPALAQDAALYLGLIAFREGRSREATALFQAAAETRDVGLRSSATRLLSLAHQEGPLLVSVLGQTLYDSNLTLSPSGAPAGADGAAGLTALLRWSPLGARGPFVRASAQYNEQLQLHSYDLGFASAGAGVNLAGGGLTFLGEYAFDFLTLGGTPYLAAHQLLGAARAGRGALSLGVSYSARFERFLTPQTALYSGLQHTARADVLWQGTGGSWVLAGFQLARVFAQQEPLSYFEYGPLVQARFGLGRRLWLTALADYLERPYDALDPDLQLQRSDHCMDGEAGIELDFADRWAAQLVVTGRRALSNADGLSYDKLTCALRVSFTTGVP